MARISDENKQMRKSRVLNLLKQYTNGLNAREIAEILNYERRTVDNYLDELRREGAVEKDGRLWFLLSRRPKVARSFTPSAEEAVILYLAARLFVKQSDVRNETAEFMLEKLAEILSEDIELGDDLRAAAQELAQRPKDVGYEDILKTVMLGYIHRLKLQIVYHPYRGKPFKTTFSCYLLEPSGIGFSTYAIGHSSISNSIRTYKIERIQQARLLARDEYSVPSDFPGLDLLRNAWSIFYGEATIHVVLRFHPDVVRRVRESIWHPSQQLKEDWEKRGYLRLTVEVADTTDLKPWIRGWGANCEVLEPVELRNELMGEARQLAALYGWHTSTDQSTNDAGPDHSRFSDIFGR